MKHTPDHEAEQLAAIVARKRAVMDARTDDEALAVSEHAMRLWACRPLAEAIREQVEEALAAALPDDLPGRLIVLPVKGEDAAGLAYGSGSIAALAAGGTADDLAVSVDVAGSVAALHDEPLADRVGYALAVACHECAHALTVEPDPEVSPEVARVIVARADAVPGVGGARVHHPRWAGAFLEIVFRLADHIPWADHQAAIRWAFRSLQAAGHCPYVLMDALAGIDTAGSIRDAFAPGSPAAAALDSRCDDHDARQRVIDRNRTKPAALASDAA